MLFQPSNSTKDQPSTTLLIYKMQKGETRSKNSFHINNSVF